MVRRLVAHLPLTSPPIGQALALDALGGNGGALEIGDVARIVAEVEFAEIAFQVFGRNPLVVAIDAAFEDRELVFHRVRVPEFTSNILFDRVIEGAVA